MRWPRRLCWRADGTLISKVPLLLTFADHRGIPRNFKNRGERSSSGRFTCACTSEQGMSVCGPSAGRSGPTVCANQQKIALITKTETNVDRAPGGVCAIQRSRGGGGGVGMSPWCIVLVCSGRRLLADRHSLPFPWTLSLHWRWCPPASHRPVPFLLPPNSRAQSSLWRAHRVGGRGGIHLQLDLPRPRYPF